MRKPQTEYLFSSPPRLPHNSHGKGRWGLQPLSKKCLLNNICLEANSELPLKMGIINTISR